MAQMMTDVSFGPIFITAALPILSYKHYLVSEKKEGKNSLMAQTMHLALFGPVFVAAAPPIVYFIDYHYIGYKPLLVSKKEEEMKKKKKKTHLWPKQHIWHCLGPFLLPLPLPSCVS